MIKNIFFDFDGVLVESVNVKTEAFRKMYLPYGDEIATKVVEYHLANGGVSRFEKIKYWHYNHLNKELTKEQIEELAQEFSSLALKGVIEAEEVKGAFEFLEANNKKYQCWIITGTPGDEIVHILNEKDWHHFFIQAFGSPQKKQFWADHIISSNNLTPSETVFVGDALADYEAAKHAGVTFILRHTEDNKELFKNYTGLSINDISELESVLMKL